MTPSRIVHLTPKLNAYGACRAIATIAAHQATRSKVTILALEEAQDEGHISTPNVNVQVLFPGNLPAGPWPLATPVIVARVRAALRALRPDIVHIHLFGHGLGLSWGTWLSGALYVGHLHEVPRADGLTGINDNVLRYLRVFYSRGNLISLTEAARAMYAERGLLTHAVPNGIDLPLFDRQLAHSAPGFPEQVGRKVLLAVRLEPKKDPEMLLRVAERLTAEPDSAVRFYVAGTGPLAQELNERIQALGLSNHIVLLGYRDDVPALMRDCDVVCLTSIEEGFGLVLLEAGAAGKPCVATSTSGARTVLREGHTGFLVPIGDDEAMAGRIALLLRDDRLRHSMGAAARQRVETTFTADAQALAVQRVYDSILVNRKPLLAHPGSEGDVRRRAIVHLTPKLNTYGACRVAHSIAQRQCAKDQVTMLALEEPKGEGRLPSPEVCSQVLFPQGVPRGTLPTRTVLVAWKTRAALKALRPDLVHVHIFGEGLALCLAAWMSGAPYAGHLHTVPTAGGTTGIGRNVLRYLRVFFRQGNLLALTPAGQEAFAEQGLLADVVPNGIDLSWFDSQLRDLPPAFADGATARVLLVGKLVSYKDPMTFLRAAQRVVAGSGPGVRFYLAGEGDLRGSLTNQIRELGLSSSVVLLGLRDNVPALMRDCDVVCLTSLEEGFGLVLAEAGAARKPCVATATSGARCVVQDGLTGFTVPVGDDQALADRLLQLVGDDDLRRSMGEAARQRVETLYTLDAQMLALERAYERVLASSRRCRPATRERA